MPATRKAMVDDVVQAAKRLEVLGWECQPIDSGHLIKSPEGGTVTVHTSGGSDHRTTRNMASELSKIGFDVALQKLSTIRQATRRAALDTDRERNQLALDAAEDALAGNTDDPPAEPATVKPLAPRTAAKAAVVKPKAGAKGAPAAVAWSSLSSDHVPRPSGTRDEITRTEEITPERAAELIARPFTARTSDGTLLRQRRVKPKQVEKLVDIIRRGEWRLLPHGAVLCPDGNVLDGQHRLHAIAKAGVTVAMRVTYNCPADNFAAIDTGVVRGAADSLVMTGFGGNAMHAASTMKLLICYYEFLADPTGTRPWRSWGGWPISNDQIVAAARRWPDLGDHLRIAHNTAGPSKLVVASLTAFRQITVDAWPAGRDLLDEFCEDLRPDRATRILEPGHPALTLRNWALNHPGKGISNKRETTLLLLLKHFAATAEGKPIKAIVIRDDAEMPTPYKPSTRRRKAA